MKLYFQYRSPANEVVSYSDAANKNDKLLQIYLDVEQEELNKLANGWRGFIEDNHLKLKMSDSVLRKEKIAELKNKLTKSGVTIEDIKDLLIDLLT